MGDVDGCPCWLEKVAIVAKPKHACKLIGAIDYSLGSAAKCTVASPCTNRPIKCTICNKVVWSYSMADHFKDKHSRVQMPPGLLKAVQLDFHEKALVMQLLNKYKATKVC